SAGPRCLDLAITRRRCGHEVGEEMAREVRNLGDGTVEHLLVRLRRLLHPAHLADVLERRRLDLLGGRRWLEVVERLDVPAHTRSLAAVDPPAAAGVECELPAVPLE